MCARQRLRLSVSLRPPKSLVISTPNLTKPPPLSTTIQQRCASWFIIYRLPPARTLNGVATFELRINAISTCLSRFIAFELKIKVVSSPALQSRSNLILAFAVRAQFCSETSRDVEVTPGAGSTTGGSIQLPYNCSTNEANLISFQLPTTTNGGETTRYRLASELPPTSNCPTRSNCVHKTKRIINSTGTRRSAPASAQRL